MHSATTEGIAHDSADVKHHEIRIGFSIYWARSYRDGDGYGCSASCGVSARAATRVAAVAAAKAELEKIPTRVDCDAPLPSKEKRAVFPEDRCRGCGAAVWKDVETCASCRNDAVPDTQPPPGSTDAQGLGLLGATRSELERDIVILTLRMQKDNAEGLLFDALRDVARLKSEIATMRQDLPAAVVRALDEIKGERS